MSSDFFHISEKNWNVFFFHKIPAFSSQEIRIINK